VIFQVRMASDSNQTKRETEAGEHRIVREAQTSDAEQIKHILDEANLTPFESRDPLVAAANQTATSQVHVCEVSGEVLAVLQWRQVGPQGEIFDLAVDSAHRRQGLASLLLDSVLDLAKSGGAKEIFLEVRESNVAALSLYKKYGFSVTGRRSNYYRNPPEAALLLRLNLTG